MSLKSYTRYRCLNKECGYGGPWTGASTDTPDNCRGCGTPLVEEVDEGVRYRLSWEMVGPYGHGQWHPKAVEHTSAISAREQWDGLHTLMEDGEPIRNIKIEKSTATWEEVDW